MSGVNISIIIPQVFYDLIARILPGFFFLVLALLSFPEFTDYLSPLSHGAKGNFVDSVGQGLVYTVFCYFWGWLFFAFVWGSKRHEIYHRHQSLLSIDDFIDLPSLANKLKQPADAVSAYLADQLSAATRKMLKDCQCLNPVPGPLQITLLKDLNSIIRGLSIYDAERFAGVSLRPESEQLCKEGLKGDALRRLNRLLLEDAFPLEISRHPKSLNSKYQWIRLAHPDAGFRILKLRAEARMFETTRTAMAVLVVLAIVYCVVCLVFLRPPLWPLTRAFWIRPLLGSFVAAVCFRGFRRSEVRAWDYYWANIRSVYQVLHDATDPVKPLATGQADTAQKHSAEGRAL